MCRFYKLKIFKLKLKAMNFEETTDGINMGQMIRKTLKEQKMSISDFAKTIHCSRANVYSIFQRQSIDIERLKQIAKVLDLDVTDFIVVEKKESSKCIVVMEVDNEDLEQMLNKYDVTCIKRWKTG